MLSPKYKRIADHLEKLISEGQTLPQQEQTRTVFSTVAAVGSSRSRSPKPEEYKLKRIGDSTALLKWYVQCENLLQKVFGEISPHLNAFRSIGSMDDSRIDVSAKRIGVLQAALADLNYGFLNNQELLVASEIFDNLIEQAKHLLSTGYKDPAAVLGRVILEDTIRRLARQNNTDATSKASIINDGLKLAGVYNQPQWRQVQVWLDIGNKAAHGQFGDYSEQQVSDMLDGIESFLAVQC